MVSPVTPVLGRSGEVAGGMGGEDEPVGGAGFGVVGCLVKRSDDRDGLRCARADIFGGQYLGPAPHLGFVVGVGSGEFEG